MQIAVEHLSKSFPGTKALDDVELRVEAGEIHALVGANGSGKSTLVKVLTGVYQPDSGSILLDGRRLSAIPSPASAVQLGIRVVHQEAPLVDTLPVAESVALFRGYPTGAFGRVRWAELRRSVDELFGRLDIPVDPNALGGALPPAERALVALAIALDDIEGHAQVLILDEASASLSEDEAGIFLRRVRALARQGLSVLMVTHRIKEVPTFADRVTVLANGKVTHRGPAAEADEEFIISRMIGQTAASLRTDGQATESTVESLWMASGRSASITRGSGPVLEAEHIFGHSVKDVSFSLQGGEIIGITGLADSGVVDLPYMLAGALDRSGGRIQVKGTELPLRPTPSQAIGLGVALVPADRLRQGGVRSLSLSENLILTDARRFWRNGQREKATVSAAMEELDIQPRRPRTLFERLSGGNQQKVVLSKWLLVQPAVLILDDPTSGVDPQSRRRVFDAVRAAAGSGIGVILLSSEHEQLTAMCSRVLVLRSGTIAARLQGAELTQESVAQWSYA